MSDGDRWVYIQEALTGIRTDVAVIISRADGIEKKLADQEIRIRQLEADVGNNKLVLRAVFLVSAAIGSSALAVAASAIKEIIL